MIDAALAQLIAGVAGVDQRINPGTDSVIVTKDLPRLVYSLIDDPPQYTDSGVMDLRKAQYQLDAFAAGYDDARAIIGRITRRADAPTNPGLDGYIGTVADTTIKRIYFTGNTVGRTPAVAGQNQVVARASVDVLIIYRELL